MNLTISWNNYNGGTEDAVNVYRDVNPINTASLPTPLVTLPAGSTSYVDATVVRGMKYYYVIGIQKGGIQNFTFNQVVRAVAPADTGPGPQSIVRGDWDLGFFGRALSKDLITYTNLTQFLGISTGTAFASDADWFKIAYKGKVLFIASLPLRYALPFSAIYNAGAVYGTNDNGLVIPQGLAGVNQYKPVTINSNITVIPRLLQGLPATTSVLPGVITYDNGLLAAPGSNEWDDIIGSLHNVPRWNGDVSYGTLGNLPEELMIPSSGANQTTYMDFCQQVPALANSIVLLRGARNTGGYYPGSLNSLTPSAVSGTLGGIANQPSTTPYGAWRPVLELVL